MVLDLEGGSRTHTHTRCLDLAAYLDSHRGQASPVEEGTEGRGWGQASLARLVLMHGGVALCCRARHLLLRALWHQVKGVLVVVEVGWCVPARVVAAELHGVRGVTQAHTWAASSMS